MDRAHQTTRSPGGHAAFCIQRESGFAHRDLSSSVRAYVSPAVLGRVEVWEGNLSSGGEGKPPITQSTPCYCRCGSGSGAGVCRCGPRSGTTGGVMSGYKLETRLDEPCAYVGLRASKRPGPFQSRAKTLWQHRRLPVVVVMPSPMRLSSSCLISEHQGLEA